MTESDTNDNPTTDDQAGARNEAQEQPRRDPDPAGGAPDPGGDPGTAADAAADSGEKPAKKAAARKTAAKKTTAKKATARKAPAKKASAAEPPADDQQADAGPEAPATSEEAEVPATRPRKKAASRRTAKAASAEESPAAEQPDAGAPVAAEGEPASGAPMVLFQPPEKKTPARRTRKKAAEAPPADTAAEAEERADSATPDEEPTPSRSSGGKGGSRKGGQPETAEGEATREEKGRDRDKEAGDKPAKGKKSGKKKAEPRDQPDADTEDDRSDDDTSGEGRSDEGRSDEGDSGDAEGGRRRRRRGGRRRRRGGGDDSSNGANGSEDSDEDSDDDSGEGEEGGSRRRRTRNRQPKSPEDEITSVSGSTRLEAKKQRRREGREAGRRRAPIVSEAEFLARRESVDRVMVIRQKDDLTQIGVLEDKVLVEHYVARESQTSLIGNIYLGRVQNVLPSMEAAFVDIGKGRNAVLYAGEVNWKALGHKDGQPRKIESVLSSGQTVLVQVTKDPVGHKGARLTGQISLPGRFLVYVPDGTTSGISRKLPDTERTRLKNLLKDIVPDTAGVIVRTAAEGAAEDELTRDVERLTARWTEIEKKVASGKGPELLYGEPDLTLKVVRDLFTEDFGRLVVQGDDAWDLVQGYVEHVAPDLRERLERFEPAQDGPDKGKDLFATHRIDEQIAKGLDRKVWLPSGGSLVIDRTEAMTVVDVNTGKFTGSGGNLEETVTKNNLEAAEEIVRQLRLRDIGGIIVVDFIDMVLESNRDLVLRRLVECLGRDRTRHQVAEVTSLGLVQMTRKRIGTGLLEAFGEECQHCKGRGVLIHDHPIEPTQKASDEPRGRRSRGGRSRGRDGGGNGSGNGGGNGHGSAPAPSAKPTPKDLAGTRPPSDRDDQASEEAGHGDTPAPADGGQPSPAPERATEQPESKAGPQPEAAADARPEQQPEAEPEPAKPVDTSPKVVTTRRRRAARPAGPPASASAGTAGSDGRPTPGDAAAAGEQDGAQDAPADSPSEGSAGEDSGAEGSLLHVPVKKKGSRKR